MDRPSTSPPPLLNEAMVISVALLSAPWFQSSLVLLALLAANATPLVRAEDTVAAGRPLSGDDKKLVSRGGKFALGFFRPDEGDSGSWYVGIWYHNISVRTPVWVANRDWPVSDPATSRLTIAADGNLVLLDGSGTLAWSTNVTTGNTNNGDAAVAAVLLDTGNLVLAPASSNASDHVLWQSFDHIGDTWLPGAKLRRDKQVTGVVQGMTSWKSSGDPAPGLYTLQLDPGGGPGLVLLRNGKWEDNWAIADWNGRSFIGTNLYSFQFVNNDRESYLTYSYGGNSFTTALHRFVTDVSGHLRGSVWLEATQAWVEIYTMPGGGPCANPGFCGAFGVCGGGSTTICGCPTGFNPRDPVRWGHGNFSGGCKRNANLRRCNGNSGAGQWNEEEGDRFFLMLSTRLPDDGRVAAGASGSFRNCERACLGDCTCSAFAYKNGSCILWYGDLQNLGNFYDGAGVGSLYLRLAASELPGGSMSHSKRRTVEIGVVGAVAIVCVVVAAFVLVVRCTTTAARRRAAKVHNLEGCSVTTFKYRDLQSFTKNFSDKLGGGSFGSVFRGQLPGRTSTMIAVKKLEGIRQGEKQFRAEVSTLGTVRHVNLIRLLGFCSDPVRKLLVYEYMPNGSLDRHLFCARQNDEVLSWRARYQIAVGVAKGLSYLHDKCRDCIIHCDVKPENIVLDADLAPKVADFGLAKLLSRDLSRVLTTMRGTIGYLAPEWIGGEPITTKADVYSYGMMLFEIVSGRRNVVKTGPRSEPSSSGTNNHAAAEFFPVLAARMMAEAEKGDVKALLLDPALGGDADAEEVTRVCKVASWCIQDEVDARPTMGEVVHMLEGVTEIEVPPVPRYLQMLAGRWTHVTRDYSS